MKSPKLLRELQSRDITAQELFQPFQPCFEAGWKKLLSTNQPKTVFRSLIEYEKRGQQTIYNWQSQWNTAFILCAVFYGVTSHVSPDNDLYLWCLWTINWVIFCFLHDTSQNSSKIDLWNYFTTLVSKNIHFTYIFFNNFNFRKKWFKGQITYWINNKKRLVSKFNQSGDFDFFTKSPKS